LEDYYKKKTGGLLWKEKKLRKLNKV
jgi:hypothetical protein